MGGVLGDLLWYEGGRRFGERTLRTVCLLSSSRDTCVRKTERFFGRWGVRVLIVGRFVPGLTRDYQLVTSDRQIEVPKYVRPRTDTPKLAFAWGGAFATVYPVSGAGGFEAGGCRL